MPTTVASAFELLAANLVPPASAKEKGESHRASIKACLDAEFNDSVILKRIGSSRYGTDVYPYSDDDFLAWVSFSGSLDTLLQRSRTALAARFPNTTVTVRRPAVQLQFASGAEQTEVVPAVYSRTDGDDYVYLITPEPGISKETAPEIHKAYITSQNTSLNSRLKPLIRMVKLWKYNNGLAISSFYVEMRVAKLMAAETSIVYKHDFRSVLRHFVSCSFARLQDPTKLSGYIEPCTTAQADTALTRCKADLARVERAFQAEDAGDVVEAFRLWREVFISGFPSYG